jgi:hypothetical protein
MEQLRAPERLVHPRFHLPRKLPEMLPVQVVPEEHGVALPEGLVVTAGLAQVEEGEARGLDRADALDKLAALTLDDDDRAPLERLGGALENLQFLARRCRS